LEDGNFPACCPEKTIERRHKLVFLNDFLGRISSPIPAKDEPHAVGAFKETPDARSTSLVMFKATVSRSPFQRGNGREVSTDDVLAQPASYGDDKWVIRRSKLGKPEHNVTFLTRSRVANGNCQNAPGLLQW